MDGDIIEVGDKVTVRGKTYVAVKQPDGDGNSCDGCAFKLWNTCPIKSSCSNNAVVLVIPPKLEIGNVVVRQNVDKVSFQIVKQSHRGANFMEFKAPNGILLKSQRFPAWDAKNNVLNVLGAEEDSDKDDLRISCSVADFVLIVEAISDYNSGQTSNFPRHDDVYYYITESAQVASAVYSGSVEDQTRKDAGNLFSKDEEAQEAADQFAKILKPLDDNKSND